MFKLVPRQYNRLSSLSSTQPLYVAARTLKSSSKKTSVGPLAVPEQDPNGHQFEQDDKQFTELYRDFLKPASFYNACGRYGIDYFTGVPDSLLKDFCAYVTENTPIERHTIAANEGSAVALASGYHLATGKTPMVYLQNSGLGNIVNPLLSLAAPEVYSIPMCILIGWRGEPGKKDEPQHIVQGDATPALLQSLGIPFQVLPDYLDGAEKVLATAHAYMEAKQAPYAILVRRRTFDTYKIPAEKNMFEHTRESAIQMVIDSLDNSDCVVGTTGMLSRELFEYRVKKNHGHARDFLTVGSMGHASSIALGIANAKPDRPVYCLDGDGAMMMHMGSMATIGHAQPRNLKHVVINNGAHDSVGGQPTQALAGHYSIPTIAKGCGYTHTATAESSEEIIRELATLRKSEGPALLEIRVGCGSRKDLGRPTRTPVQNKQDFMSFLQS